jgi:hypothetical protein
MPVRTHYGKYGGFITIGERFSSPDSPTIESHSVSQYNGGDANVTITAYDREGTVDWKKLIRERESATTHMSVSGSTFKQGRFGFKNDTWVKDPDWGNDTYESFALGSFVDPGDVIPSDVSWLAYDDVVNQALMRFISQANSVQRSFQGGVFLGELKETIHQIRHPMSAIKSHLNTYLGNVKKRSGKLRLNGRVVGSGSLAERSRAARSSLQGVISDTWLEAQFGIKPLVHDVQDAATALARYIIDEFPSKVVKGKAKYSENLGDAFSTRFLGTGQVFTRYSRLSSLQVKIYGSVKVQCSANAAHAFALAGVTWRDFAPSLYELIPYSFLVDYFTNVGSLVEAASFNTATVAWANIGVYVKSVSEQIEQRYTPFPSPNGHYNLKGSSLTPSGPFRFEKFVKSRDQYIGGYMPSLAFKLPGIGQSLNILALIGQSRSLSQSLARRG